MDSEKTIRKAASTATEKAGAMSGVELLRKEAELSRREAFERYLEAVPNVPPQHDDGLGES